MNKIDEHEIVSRLKVLADELGKTPTLLQFVASGISKRQIQKYKYSELCKKAGLEINKHAQLTEPVDVVIRPPRMLFFDCEISEMTVKVYQLKGNDYISPKRIVKPWHFLSWAALFDHEPEKDYYLDQRYEQDKTNDRQLIEGLHYMLSQADILIGHNIKRFDVRKFNTRSALYGLPPIHGLIIYDTLTFFRRHFDLPSYSLWYICHYFGLSQEKMEHSQTMWDKCLEGDIESWDENARYNKQDNRACRAAFWFVARFEPSINIQSFHQKQICICGSDSFMKDGFKYTKNGRFQVFRCKNRECSKTFTARENLIDKDIRKNFLN
jgi:DNA polymerase elongation subunit (family B)